MTVALLQAYAQRIRDLRRGDSNVPEPALAPAFHQLLEGLIPLLTVPQGLRIQPEYRNPGVGRPDIALLRQGARPRAFVELKAPSKPADPTRWRAQDKRQFERFRELRCWAACNFAEFRLLEGGEEVDHAAVLPEHALRPDRDDARANRAIAEHDPTAFLRLLERLCNAAGQEPSAGDAPQLATFLAHSARLVSGIVLDRLGELRDSGVRDHPLLQVRQEFRDVLYAHPEAAGYPARDFDRLFSAAFAQTLAFGLLLVREGKAEGEPADVIYSDSWAEGLFSRRGKLDWLLTGADAGVLTNAVRVERGLLDDMRPRPFQNGEWVDLREVFVFSKSGMKSGNDPVFMNPLRSRLRSQIERHINRRYDEALETFYSYRPLDRRWFYNDLRLLNRPGPAMQRVWGSENVGLYALPGGTGAGPAVWCHGLLPDYHAFRGNFGGYAFPLYDRRPRVNAPNISAKLIESLSAAYGTVVSAEDVFDVILCLLSARSYTLRFAEDLEDVFSHVPFPARLAVFEDAVRIGREIRAVETFARQPREAYRRPGFARVVTEPRGVVASVDYTEGSITLCADGTGRITGIPEAVWSFAVSGYRVLPRWIESRVGLSADLSLARELRDICSRIAELIDLFVEADSILAATLRETLTRAALGLGGEEQDENGPST